MVDIEIRYPETPSIRTGNKIDTEIDYNGVRIYIGNVSFTKKRKRRNAHTVDMTLLEYDVFKQEVHKCDVPLTQKQADRLNRIDLNNSPDRTYLIKTVREYAPWFNNDTEERLEQLILSAIGKENKKAAEVNDYRSDLMKDHREEQERARFCTLWKLILSHNITQEEAEEMLRKGNYDRRRK
ncbi:MAG: hypothetical protein V1729_06150 [Candidatus Woesearchaeota archaeon]